MNTRDTRTPPKPLIAATITPVVHPVQQGLALFQATPPDYERAAGWFRTAAAAGDAEGMTMLALCQLEGLGVAADAVQARRLLLRAAARGSANGQFQLGRVLMTGRGGPMNESDGLTAYVNAAAQAHAEATFNLASCLFAGVGCLPDRLAAKALYLRARTLGCALRPQGVMVRRRELKAVRTLATRFADPGRLVFLIQERQQELALLQAVARPRAAAGSAAAAGAPAKQRPLRKAGRLAVGVVAAMAGTLGQYLRPPSRDAGPTTLTF